MIGVRVQRSGPLVGEVRVPPDKSLSHRALLFAAMAEGTSRLRNVLDSADVRSTLDAVRALGADVRVDATRDGALDCTVAGWGARGPIAPDRPIDCGNSGTTARLLMGVLAGWPLTVTLTGDESLRSRPMDRVMRPLATMGATFRAREEGFLPVAMTGGPLRALEHRSPVASAQVKSAVLLAGLRATGTTAVIEPARSRDHTERLLPAYGVPVEVAGARAAVTGPAVPRATDVTVPGDPSSAAFLIVAAAVVPGSAVTMPDVCVNRTRTGAVEVLRRMGARVDFEDERALGAEPVATVVVRHATGLTATSIEPAEVPALIDEVPLLALAATQAAGLSRFEGVGELRVKESDRLEATVAALSAFGADVRAGSDWIELRGPTMLRSTRVHALGDHRLAMAWTVAGLAASGTTVVEGFEAVRVSYPTFAQDLRALGARIGET